MRLTELNPKWLSSGGPGITNSITGEEVPVNEHAALELDCPCGCADKCCIPFEGNSGHTWIIQGGSFDFETLTITPSVQRTFNPSMCKKHFCITNGEITA